MKERELTLNGVLGRVAIKLSEIKNLRGRSQEIVDIIAPWAKCDAIFTYRPTTDGGFMVVSSYLRQMAQDCSLESQIFTPTPEVCGHLNMGLHGAFTQDDLERYDVKFPVLPEGRYGSVLVYPMDVDTEIMGFMLFCRYEKTPWKNEDWLEAIASMLCTAIRLTIFSERLTHQIGWRDKVYPIIAHDLRGGVGNVAMLLEAISGVLEKGQLSAEDTMDVTSMVSMARNSSGETFMLLDNLLKWSRENSGGAHFQPQSVAVEQLIEGYYSLFLSMTSAKEIEYIFDFDEVAGMVVEADVQMIRTVIRNLISNAIKFTGIGGRIIVSGRVVDGRVELSVMDSGVGLSESQVKMLLDGSDYFTTYGTGGEKGSGLGFALCRMFVGKHGSSIAIESKQGEGSRFSFSLAMGR